MPIDQSHEAVLNRIRALLNLANHPNTPEHEASNAMARAQAMMQKHNLSQFNISDKPDPSAINEDLSMKEPDDRKGAAWRRAMMDTICRVNYCRLLIHHQQYSDSTTWMVFGRPENIEASKMLYQFIVEQMEHLAAQAWKAYTGPEKRGSFRRGFYSGCTYRVSQRLHEQFVAQERETEMTKALVVVRGTEVTDYINAKYRVGQGRKGSGYSGSAGKAAGAAAGDRVQLNNHKRLPGQ